MVFPLEHPICWFSELFMWDELNCLVPLALEVKTVYFQLKDAFFEQIRTGEKVWEFRAASGHWVPRLRGATHVVFSAGSLIGYFSIFSHWNPIKIFLIYLLRNKGWILVYLKYILEFLCEFILNSSCSPGYSSRGGGGPLRLKALRILEVREVDVAGARALGCPSGREHELGLTASKIFAIHFEKHVEQVPWFQTSSGTILRWSLSCMYRFVWCLIAFRKTVLCLPRTLKYWACNQVVLWWYCDKTVGIVSKCCSKCTSVPIQFPIPHTGN